MKNEKHTFVRLLDIGYRYDDQDETQGTYYLQSGNGEMDITGTLIQGADICGGS